MTLVMLALLGACAPAWRIDEDAFEVKRQLVLLEGNRFVPKCAPEEWAMAKAHEEFARVEVSQGDGNRARDHLDVALRYTGLTVSKTAACAPGDPDGDGMEDDIDKCPAEPEDKDGDRDNDGCPDIDSDGDGQEDDVDQCIMAPEDLDGFKDTDGCPDLDNDGDSIADELDRCPVQAEVLNGYMDTDGCPDVKPQKVVVKKKTIDILEKVNFEHARATIQPDSFALLDEVATVILENPDIRVRIEGHTDNVGEDAENLALSQARAESVLEYLVGKGIDRARLTAVGLGETQPIDTNRTDEGKAANRRVEFHILREADAP